MPTNERVLAELKTYEATGELVNGSAERLAQMWSGALGNLSPERLAERVREQLESDFAKRYANPEYQAPTGPSSPLRRVLRRIAPELAGGESAIDELVESWAVDMAGRTEAKIAGEVRKRLLSREYRDVARNPAPLPMGEVRLASILREHFGSTLGETQVQRLAREESLKLGHMQAHEVVRAVARSLRIPAVATKAGLDSPLAADDWRLTATHRDVVDPMPYRREAGAKSLSL